MAPEEALGKWLVCVYIYVLTCKIMFLQVFSTWSNTKSAKRLLLPLPLQIASPKEKSLMNDKLFTASNKTYLGLQPDWLAAFCRSGMKELCMALFRRCRVLFDHVISVCKCCWAHLMHTWNDACAKM